MTYKGAIDEVKMLSQNPMMPDIFKPSLNKIAETLEMEKEIEHCEVCISKQAVLKLPRKTMYNYYGAEVGDVVWIDDIESLPPVQPIRPKGEWIFKEITNDYHVTGQCSRCKQRNRIDNFCPNCGADMRTNNLKYADQDTMQGGLMSAT